MWDHRTLKVIGSVSAASTRTSAPSHTADVKLAVDATSLLFLVLYWSEQQWDGRATDMRVIVFSVSIFNAPARALLAVLFASRFVVRYVTSRTVFKKVIGGLALDKHSI